MHIFRLSGSKTQCNDNVCRSQRIVVANAEVQTHFHMWQSKWPPPHSVNIGQKETQFPILNSLKMTYNREQLSSVLLALISYSHINNTGKITTLTRATRMNKPFRINQRMCSVECAPKMAPGRSRRELFFVITWQCRDFDEAKVFFFLSFIYFFLCTE